MGRSKPVPKRRKVQDETAEAEALQVLKETPAQVLEEAAAEATRLKIADWPRVFVADDEDSATSLLAPCFCGLGKIRLEPQNFEALRAMHDFIHHKATKWTTWSGAAQDARRRAFATFPNTLGGDKFETIFSSSHVALDQEYILRLTSHQVPAAFVSALEALCRSIRPLVPSTSQSFVDPAFLIAGQPNLHCGQALLPAHLDHPTKEYGFGVVIVTIAMRGSADVFLTSANQQEGVVMPIQEGYAYVLSGPARDQCTHGVVTDPDSCFRESFNLRFGLHDYDHSIETNDGKNDILRVSSETVLKHWS